MNLHDLLDEARRLARTAWLVAETRTATAVPLGWRTSGPSGPTGYLLDRGDHRISIGGSGGEPSVSTAPIAGRLPPGEPLFGTRFLSMPPLEAIFVRGSEALGAWLRSSGWDPSWGYNDNFPDPAASDYESWWQDHHQFYQGEGIAILGGWHFAWPDDDWLELVDHELVMWTLGEEPWLEVWALPEGGYRAIERCT